MQNEATFSIKLSAVYTDIGLFVSGEAKLSYSLQCSGAFPYSVKGIHLSNAQNA